MNELMISIIGGSWIYYKTKQDNADKALTEFSELCDNSGINIDNLEIESYELRDVDGNAK